MFTSLHGVRLTAIAAAIPVNNPSIVEYAPDILDEKGAKRLSKTTGFTHLRIADSGTTTSDLCLRAACELSASGVDGLIFVSQTPDYKLPATSHVLQHRLGLGQGTFCFDVNQGCSGYVQGLYLASLLVSTNQCSNVLLLVGDTISKMTNSEDRSTRCIFGDAGAATLIQAGDGVISFGIESWGESFKTILTESGRRGAEKSMRADYLTMDGMGVMNFTLNEVPVHMKESAKIADLSLSDIQLFACHQANKLILASLADRLGVSHEKLPFACEKIGNTSSASIPLMLTQKYCDATVRDDLRRVMCCGFGVGLSVASAIVDLSQTRIYPTVEL